MKKFILTIACMLTMCGISFAQVSPEQVSIEDNSYSIVVNGDLPIATKFLNAREWIAKTFGDYKSVLQFEDEENGKIIIKGTTPLEQERKISSFPDFYTPKMSYTITLDFKDDRFRIKMEDIVFDVRNDMTLLSRITSNKTYDYAGYIAASEYSSTTSEIRVKELQEEIETLKAKGESLKKKDLKKLEELENELSEELPKIEQQGKIQIKRENEVKVAIASLVSSLSKAVNTSDDF